MFQIVKVFRHQNHQLGFDPSSTTLNNFLLPEPELHELTSSINRQFLLCQNKQSQSLLKASVDPEQKMTTLFALLLLLPVLKALLVTDFQFMAWQYALIFIMGVIVISFQFGRCNSMKQVFVMAETHLNQELSAIRQDFNHKSSNFRLEYEIEEGEELHMARCFKLIPKTI